jgi:phenylacetate-coenzyme A ligase PaaK-like adenylate-forming protein
MISQEDIFSIASKKEFEKITLKVFRYQYENNKVYQSFCNHLGKSPSNVKQIAEIPFLPIQFFKSDKIVSSTEEAKVVFTSNNRNDH